MVYVAYLEVQVRLWAFEASRFSGPGVTDHSGMKGGPRRTENWVCQSYNRRKGAHRRCRSPLVTSLRAKANSETDRCSTTGTPHIDLPESVPWQKAYRRKSSTTQLDEWCLGQLDGCATDGSWPKTEHQGEQAAVHDPGGPLRVFLFFRNGE